MARIGQLRHGPSGLGNWDKNPDMEMSHRNVLHPAYQNLSLIWHSRSRVAEAPSERAMKRLAEERLMAIQLAEISRLGTYYLLSLIL